MIQTVTVKIGDKTGLNEREKNIFQASTMNLVAMASMVVVIKKGEGGEGAAFNPLEDDNYPLGITMIYAKAINPELAEELKSSLESRFENFFKMSKIDMTIEVELS